MGREHASHLYLWRNPGTRCQHREDAALTLRGRDILNYKRKEKEGWKGRRKEANDQ
jgi:hypothetical protein